MAPTRQTAAATSEKKKMRNTPTPRPMTRVSPFSVKPSAETSVVEDILDDAMIPVSPYLVPPYTEI